MNRKTKETIESVQPDWHKYWKDKALEERKLRMELEERIKGLEAFISVMMEARRQLAKSDS